MAGSELKWCPKGCGKTGKPSVDDKYKCERCGFVWKPA
jgi:hypothetical protein